MSLSGLWARTWRVLFWGLGLVGILLLLVVVILETSTGRSALLRFALGAVESRTGLVARAEGLDVAILRREVRVRALSLGLPGAEPLLRAAHVRLAWGVGVSRGLMPESVDVEGVRIDVRRGADGRWNLPVGRGGPAPGPGAPILPLRISVRDVAIALGDAASGFEAQVSGISLLAAGSPRETTGTLDIKDPLRWRVGGQTGEITFTPAAFRLDQSFTLKEWSARSSEGTVRLEGTWSDIFGAGGLGLAFVADVDLEHLAARLETPPRIAGSLRLEGRVSGTRAEGPRADVTWRGDDTRAAGRRMSLTGRAAITGKGLDVGAATVRVAGGSVEGSGRVGFAAAEPSRVEARWKRLDLGSLLAPDAERQLLSGLLAGHLVASWPGLEWRRANAQMVVEASDSGNDGMKVEGQARLDLRAGKWTVETNLHSRDDALLTGQLGGAIGSVDLGATSVAGRLDLEARDLAPLVDALRLGPVAGQASGTLLVSGTLASPRADIDLSGQGLRLGQNPPADVSAQGTVDRSSLAVLGFEVHAGSAHAQAAGQLLFASGGLDGRYEIDLPDLAAFGPNLPAGFDPKGALHGKGSLAGPWKEPRVTLSANGTDLLVAGQGAETGRFELRLEGPWLRADAVELVQAHGKLSALGAYNRKVGQFSVSAHARTFEVGPLPAGLVRPEGVRLSGKVDLDFEGGGGREAAEGRGHLTLADGQWEGRSLGPIAADLALTKEGLRADLTADDLSARAEVTIGLDPPHVFSVAARLEGSDVKTAARLSGLDASNVSGTVSLRAEASGSADDMRGAKVSLTVDKLSGAVQGRSVRLDHQARLEMAPGQFRVGALALSVGDSRVSLDGALNAKGEGVLKGSIQGRLGDLAGILADRAAAPEPAAPLARFDGTADVSFVVSGPLERPRVSAEGRLEEGVFRFGKPELGKPELPPIEHVNVKGSLDAGTLRLDHLEAAWSGASLVASGDVTGSFLKTWLPANFARANSGPAPRASLRARLEGDAGLVLAPFLNDSVRSSGRIAVFTADLSADDLRPDAVRGEVRIEGFDLHTSDAALSQATPATLRVEAGRLKLEGATWTGPATELRLAAEARIGPKDDPVGGALLEAELTGDADLRLLQAFARGIESGGTGSFRLKVAGTPAALRPEGEIHLRGGALRHRPTRMALDGLTGTMRWSRSGFELLGLKGSFNGGPMEASGSLRRRESGPGFEGAIRFQARNAYVEWPPGLRAGLRANLVLEPEGDGLRLAGTLRVLDGTYRTREYFSVQVLDVVNRFSGEASPSPFDPLRLDIGLRSSQDVQLDAVDGRFAVGLDLHFGGTVGKPVLGGRLTAGAGGQLFMSGRTYDVESAILDFTRGGGFEPYVQARAVTRVAEYTIVADVVGPATRVQTRFVSNPPLGQQDIVALLTSGRTVGAGGTGSQGDALSMASGGMLGKTGQMLGLDSLQISSSADPQSLDFDPTAVSSDADPASRLTFSKRLASNLSATFSRSLTKSGSYTWFVAWKPKPPLELRVVQRDDQSGALEFRHDITFGGGKPEVAPSRRRRRQRRRSGETVSAVSLTGDPGVTRSDLKMGEGQAFDYERWLADRDRLEEKLARAGYNEGRVLASRETPPSEGAAPARRLVELVYDVRRGPRTTLTIEGVPSPAALHDRIESAWRLGDYGSSIEDEALALARAHLYEKGFLRAQVTARVSRSPQGDVKTLTVRAEPGTPVTSRHIRFEGNALVSTDRLEALVRDAQREEAAWLRPEDLREAVLTLYRREGLLATQVSVASPTFSGDEAVLTVKIDEGPVVPIREVLVTGAERLSPEAVRAAAGLVEGQPFKPAEIENAKALVEAAYRRLGYNEATVASHGELDAATGSMKVELQVGEGQREVLAEVAVEGGSPKAQARMRRRLGLTPGDPVVLDEWTEARRRIYETGLFRRVDLEPSPSPSGTEGEGDRLVKATLRLEDWPALRLRYGLQALRGETLASEEGRKELQVGAVAEVSRQTILGRAASVGASFQVRRQDQEARAYLSVPRSFGTPLRSSLFLTVTPEHVDNESLGGQVDIRKTELTWEERIRATRKLEFAAAEKVQWSRLTFAPLPDLGESGRLDIKLVRLVGTALFDARNDLIDTTRGSFSSASYEWGGSAIGSDYPLTRTFLQQFVYVPITGGVVFGAAGRAERASGQGSAFLDSDRLQAGGANTVRGYTEDALTSRSVINLLGGSTTLVVLNAEVRFPIYGPVRGVLFGDGAISTARFSEETSRESIWSTGIGLRYVTPAGILRLDYGIPLDDGWTPKRGRVYFSLGQVF